MATDRTRSKVGFTADEWEDIDRCARRAGKTRATWLREVALAAASRGGTLAGCLITLEALNVMYAIKDEIAAIGGCSPHLEDLLTRIEAAIIGEKDA